MSSPILVAEGSFFSTDANTYISLDGGGLHGFALRVTAKLRQIVDKRIKHRYRLSIKAYQSKSYGGKP